MTDDNLPLPAHMRESMPIDTKPAFSFPSEAASISHPSDIPANFQNPYGVKYDTRISTSIELGFESVETDTAKALLLNIFDENTGKVLEEWFPKKLCSNLDEHACTIRVWEVFAKDKKGHLFPATPSFPDTEAEAKPNG
jgi:hypothetical protein